MCAKLCAMCGFQREDDPKFTACENLLLPGVCPLLSTFAGLTAHIGTNSPKQARYKGQEFMV